MVVVGSKRPRVWCAVATRGIRRTSHIGYYHIMYAAHHRSHHRSRASPMGQSRKFLCSSRRSSSGAEHMDSDRADVFSCGGSNPGKDRMIEKQLQVMIMWTNGNSKMKV